MAQVQQSIADTTGAAPWSTAVITVDTTTGAQVSGDYQLRNNIGVEHLDFNAQGALNDSVYYLTSGYTIASYYGVNSNPALPFYSFSQYTYAPGGLIQSIIGVFNNQLYVNNTP